MAKYKVVCNKKNCLNQYRRELEIAKELADSHKSRLGHNPIYIYELEEEQEFTSTQLLTMNNIELSKENVKIVYCL